MLKSALLMFGIVALSFVASIQSAHAYNFDDIQFSKCTNNLSLKGHEGAERYELSFFRNPGGGNFLQSTGITGSGGRANYNYPIAQAGKGLEVFYSGFLVNKYRDLQDAKMFMGYMGQDRVAHYLPVTIAGSGFHGKVSWVVPVEMKSLKVWFELHEKNDNVVYDSQHSKNYSIEILKEKNNTLCFDREWREVSSKPLRNGEVVELYYDNARVLDFLEGQTYNGMASYALVAHYRAYDSADELIVNTTLRLEAQTYDNGSERNGVPFKAIFKVPEAAIRIEFWFAGTGRGKPHYDSNEGKNYNIFVH